MEVTYADYADSHNVITHNAVRASFERLRTRVEALERKNSRLREALECVCDAYLMGHDTEGCEIFDEYGECEDCELVPKVNAALSRDGDP